MKILVVNDDGITSPGIVRLAKMAKQLGEVTVVAPASQCSAMSQRITVFGEMVVKKESFPVEGVKAYSVTGTPADCVKVAIEYMFEEKPDYCFSGINHGYNAGYDILYSGTIGAAVEALSEGVPAMAFSCEMNDDFTVVDEYILQVTKDLLKEPIAKHALWNINFPGCSLEEFKGIKRNVNISKHQLYLDNYLRSDIDENTFVLKPQGIPVTESDDGTDICAVGQNYISIGVVESSVLKWI